MTDAPPPVSTGGTPPRIYAVLLFAVGAASAAAGVMLALLGGSPYYATAGLAVIASAIMLWRGRLLGAWLYAAMLLGTLVWAFWEVRLDAWQLLPRLLMWTVLGLWLLLPRTRRGLA